MKRLFYCVVALSVVLFSAVGQSATGTISPSPFQLILDNNGRPVNAGCVWTYLAGTSTPVATYTDVGLSVPNGNPIVASSAGRFTAFLTPGVSYKFVYENIPCNSGLHGSTLVTADNIASTPASSAALETTGTAGEALTAGQAVYLSDGSGGKSAGQWYKADAAQAYSSTLPPIGIVPSSISNGASGAIRLIGQITGLSSLSVGADYYIGTAGALTTTAPGQARKVGRADSTTTLAIGLPAVPSVGIFDDFRLTLTSATYVTTADVTAATTLYWTPGNSNRVTLADSTGNLAVFTAAELSIAVPATTSQMYDVWVYNNSGTPALELLAWTNDTTRATAIAKTTTTFYTKSADLTRRYVGSFRTTTVSGQTEDSLAKRYVWNYYNRAPRPMLVIDATASWNYTTGTLRQARATATNQLDVVVGVQEAPVTAQVIANASDTTTGSFVVGIGLDSTTAIATGVTAGMSTFSASGAIYTATARGDISTGVGRHTLVWLEASISGTLTTWYGKDKFLTGISSGISGLIQG